MISSVIYISLYFWLYFATFLVSWWVASFYLVFLYFFLFFWLLLPLGLHIYLGVGRQVILGNTRTRIGAPLNNWLQGV